MQVIRHPAKYTDGLIYPMYRILAQHGAYRVLDPFAGTGKVGLITGYSQGGMISYANELGREWLEPNQYLCDYLFYQDAEYLDLGGVKVDAICTSPTYGNRMADHHEAKDGSRRNTYTHCLGHQLRDGNTGKMQWGEEYRQKHERTYKHLFCLLEKGGVFILNVKNHIRKGKEVDVKGFHVEAMEKAGFMLESEEFVETPGNRYGANGRLRTGGEYILVFTKP